MSLQNALHCGEGLSRKEEVERMVKKYPRTKSAKPTPQQMLLESSKGTLWGWGWRRDGKEPKKGRDY